MKIIKSLSESFDYSFDSTAEIHVDTEGVAVSDEQALVIARLFGQVVSIEDASLEEIIQSAKTEETPVVAEEKPLAKMNLQELTEKAATLGIVVPEGSIKKDIIKLIETPVVAEEENPQV